jgi:hypothetical protein
MGDIISSIPASASTAILLLLKEPQGEELGAIIKVPVRISLKANSRNKQRCKESTQNASIL